MKPDVQGSRVVIIDANAHIRRLIGTLLGALSIEDVIEARTPAAAAPLIQSERPDLIIVDWTNEPAEVSQLVRRLRHGELGDTGVPVLALSGSTHHAVLERAGEVGIDDVLAKPISAAEVIQRAGALIAAHRRLAAMAKSAAAAE
jgi:two-component system, OmpR family, phosphate regulon response regulator PhoB